MTNEKLKPGKKISDNIKAGILRWWLAGMCYFFIGFGTQAGIFNTPLDLIFFLGVGIGLATIVIYNPLAYGMFDMMKRGKITNHAYYERKGWQSALLNLSEIFKNILLVSLVYLTYQTVNLLLIEVSGLPEGTVLIAGEPFGFATLYLIYHSMLTGLAHTVREERQKHHG